MPLPSTSNYNLTSRRLKSTLVMPDTPEGMVLDPDGSPNQSVDQATKRGFGDCEEQEKELVPIYACRLSAANTRPVSPPHQQTQTNPTGPEMLRGGG